ncbi:MAG: hypothetical protein JW944_15225 [Deltaproteobacteria bacterium]|nr:hypothetical protein [Deltaproteobacteria bacterium]
MNRILKKTGIFLAVVVCLLLTLFEVFHSKSEIFTIGIAMDGPGFSQVVNAFKYSIAESHYAARQAHLIIKGAKPGDLSVETSEIFLAINVHTAEKIGIHIPDSALTQARNIVR